MRPRAGIVFACVALLGSGCRPRSEPERPLPKRIEPSAIAEPEHPAIPLRWTIDGSTIADEPALPSALERALRAGGREPSAVQDHVIVDLNGDGRRDALVLLIAVEAAGGFEALVLLSEGERIELRSLAEFVAANEGEAGDWPIYALSVLPMREGPTLIAAAPRPGPCEQGPLWSFVRVSGTLLEPAGRVAIEPYDCARDHDEAAIEMQRDEQGRVGALELRHRGVQTRLTWDAAIGGFAASK